MATIETLVDSLSLKARSAESNTDENSASAEVPVAPRVAATSEAKAGDVPSRDASVVDTHTLTRARALEWCTFLQALGRGALRVPLSPTSASRLNECVAPAPHSTGSSR